MEWWGGWMDDRTKRSEAGRMIETIACEVLAIGPEKIQIKTRAKKRGELTQTRAEKASYIIVAQGKGGRKKGKTGRRSFWLSWNCLTYFPSSSSVWIRSSVVSTTESYVDHQIHIPSNAYASLLQCCSQNRPTNAMHTAPLALHSALPPLQLDITGAKICVAPLVPLPFGFFGGSSKLCCYCTDVRLPNSRISRVQPHRNSPLSRF